MRIRQCVVLSVVCMAGCLDAEGPGIDEDPDTSTDRGEIGVILGRAPDGVNCINFTLTSANGTVSEFPFTTTTGLRTLPNLPAGAYELTAVAYPAIVPGPITNADCESVPVLSPWTTEAPINVVVQRALRTDINLTMLPTGRIGVTVTWLVPPVVIAQGQGQVGAMAAVPTPFSTYVTYLVHASGPNSRIMASHDFEVFPGSPQPLPNVLQTGLPNPGQLVIDPDSLTVYAQNAITRTTSSQGVFFNDGAITSSNGLFFGGINPGDLGLAVANHTPYWVGMPQGAVVGSNLPFSIDCTPCAQPLAANEIGANALTAHGDRVFWGLNDGSLRGMAVNDVFPTTLASIAPGQAYGAAADADFVYFIAVAPFEPISASKIYRVPATGGEPVLLVDGVIGGAFPLSAHNGFVYFLSGEGVKRVSRFGGPVEDLVFGVIGGFAVTTMFGRDVLYWSDVTHGGLIWRAGL